MESQDRFIRRRVLFALVYFVAAVSLGGLLPGDPLFEPAVAASSVAMLIAIVTLVVTVFRYPSRRASQRSERPGLCSAV